MGIRPVRHRLHRRATSVRTTAAPRSISCPPARSQSCRSPADRSLVSSGRSAARMPRSWSPPTTLIFETELEQRFGLQLGEIRSKDKPRAWPLGLKLARAFVAPRFALAGDAAHGIHPIAGQGLNLGFKDVAALAETVVEADRLGQDIGGARRARTLRTVAPLRHRPDGPDHRPAQPAVLQRSRSAARRPATSALAWSTACRG